MCSSGLVGLIYIGIVLLGGCALWLAHNAGTWRDRAEKAEAALEAALIGERANRTMRDTARQWADKAAARLAQISRLADWRSP